MPRESLSCNEAQTALAEIKSLKTEFDRALENAIRTGELERARTLRSGLESRMRELREGLISPVERKLDLKRQYESQRQVLDTAGILDRLPSGEHGIRGIDGKAYPIPTYQEVRDLIREKRDVLEKKAEQGFTKVLIVPFGMKLDDLVGKYKELLLRHYVDMPDPSDPSKRIPDPQRTKLFATKEKDTDSDEPLSLDTNEPVWRWSEYQGADENGKLIYDPKEFSQNHGGKTKSQILAGRAGQAWRVIVVEADPNIPRSGNGKDIGGRKRLEANKTPNEYLATIGKDEYQNESGTTPEEWLMQAITLLHEKNQALDDYQGKGSIAYNTGAYFPAAGNVPRASWDRDARQADLSGSDPAGRVDDRGARSAVRV
jgi:hypothetical protein